MITSVVVVNLVICWTASDLMGMKTSVFSRHFPKLKPEKFLCQNGT